MTNSPKKKHRLSLLAPLALLAAIILGGGYLLLRDTTPPAVELTPEQEIVALGVVFNLHVLDADSGLKRVEITFSQDGQVKQHLEKLFPAETNSYAETLLLEKDRFKDGPFEIEVMAQDASLYPFGAAGKTVLTRHLVLDATKPRLDVLSTRNYLDQGGCGLLAFTSSEPLAKAGVTVGTRFFPAYQQPDGAWFCLFAMPYDTGPAEFRPQLTGTDMAGNEAIRSFAYQADPKAFREDNLNLPDSFLERKQELFLREFPGDPETTPLGRYIKVNNELRARNAATLREIGLKTSPTPLFKGVFLRSPGKRTAGFGDRRSYLYQGQVVDHQTHMGVDLADREQSPIQASNDGVVVFADFLGIYGNAVIIDHGLGLQSIYAHLSEIHVQRGQTVTKGEEIGRSGTTGLAGGDHLHFGILVSGVPVSPVEWWDAEWIKNNITSKMAR
ncbi:MAG: M23 family metallopeptidase [Desulfovibrionaceae bacterium]